MKTLSTILTILLLFIYTNSHSQNRFISLDITPKGSFSNLATSGVFLTPVIPGGVKIHILTPGVSFGLNYTVKISNHVSVSVGAAYHIDRHTISYTDEDEPDKKKRFSVAYTNTFMYWNPQISLNIENIRVTKKINIYSRIGIAWRVQQLEEKNFTLYREFNYSDPQRQATLMWNQVLLAENYERKSYFLEIGRRVPIKKTKMSYEVGLKVRYAQPEYLWRNSFSVSSATNYYAPFVVKVSSSYIGIDIRLNLGWTAKKIDNDLD